MTGVLVQVGRDGMLVIDQREDDAAVGAVERVLVDASCRCVRGAGWVTRWPSRPAKVELGTVFLDWVRELAVPLAGPFGRWALPG